MRKLLLSVVFLVACGSNDRSETVDAPGGDPDAGGSGIACGGFAQKTCPDSEYCDYPDNSCGVADQTGMCRTRPRSCPSDEAPTCGCDNKLYAGACPMQMAGTDFNTSGNCAIERGKFACGYTQCDLQTQYCLHDAKAAAGDSYSCVTLPATCGNAAACSCLASERCGNACTGNAGTGLIATCS